MFCVHIKPPLWRVTHSFSGYHCLETGTIKETDHVQGTNQRTTGKAARHGRIRPTISSKDCELVNDLAGLSRRDAILAVVKLICGHDAYCPPSSHTYLSLIPFCHLTSLLRLPSFRTSRATARLPRLCFLVLAAVRLG